jgi:hypothetical protein
MRSRKPTSSPSCSVSPPNCNPSQTHPLSPPHGQCEFRNETLFSPLTTPHISMSVCNVRDHLAKGANLRSGSERVVFGWHSIRRFEKAVFD